LRKFFFSRKNFPRKFVEKNRNPRGFPRGEGRTKGDRWGSVAFPLTLTASPLRRSIGVQTEGQKTKGKAAECHKDKKRGAGVGKKGGAKVVKKK
jgi:hypothetical protein